jgi:transcriptional regulator with XRE-family HTH domain
MSGDVTPEGEESAPDREWRRVADAREQSLPKLGSYPISGLLRRARRIAGISQQVLARRAGVSQSTVAKAESGAMVPTLPVFERLLAVAGLRLVVVDDEGHVITPMRDIPDTRNGGDVRYPSHLDVILDPKPGEWWGDNYGLARPPETFHRDHARRAAKQRRTEWEVRANRNVGVPPPPDVDLQELLRARQEQQPAEPRVPTDIPAGDFDVEEWTEEDERAWRDEAAGDPDYGA